MARVRAAKGRVGVGMEGDWIGFKHYVDYLVWAMKNVGYEKAEFSEICTCK